MNADAWPRCGRRLDWLLRSCVSFIEDGDWYAECPVVLDFDGVQVEISHSQFDEPASSQLEHYRHDGCDHRLLGLCSSRLRRGSASMNGLSSFIVLGTCAEVGSTRVAAITSRRSG